MRLELRSTWHADEYEYRMGWRARLRFLWSGRVTVVRTARALDEAVALLRELEWAGWQDDDCNADGGYPYCPFCKSEPEHEADCGLAAAIGAPRRQP